MDSGPGHTALRLGSRRSFVHYTTTPRGPQETYDSLVASPTAASPQGQRPRDTHKDDHTDLKTSHCVHFQTIVVVNKRGTIVSCGVPWRGVTDTLGDHGFDYRWRHCVPCPIVYTGLLCRLTVGDGLYSQQDGVEQ